MPARVTRSGRQVKNSSTAQSKLDALELLARQRRGEKVDVAIKEDEPLFEDVVEDEYKSTRKGGFIVDQNSDEDDDSDLDFIDDEDFDDLDDGSASRRVGNNKERRKAKETEHDPKQRSMKSFLGASSSKGFKSSFNSAVSPSSEKKRPEVNEDDVLSAMLFDVPTNPSSSAQKPRRLISRPTTTATISQNVSQKTKAAPVEHKPKIIKRPRMASPPKDDGAAFLDDWDSNDYQDNINIMGETKPTAITLNDMDTDSMMPDDNIDIAPLNDDLKSNLEFRDLEGDKKYTKMYWYDCCEDQVKYPGVVYFFGRVYATTAKRYVSCCTIVKNISRTSYLLIKQDCTYQDVLGEFTHIIAKKFKIKSFECEKVTKKYAFSSDSKIPLLGDYLKVEYSASYGPLPIALEGETFYKVLNSNQSPMEKIILDLKLRGPCWMRLIDPVAPSCQLTWTKIELILETPKNLVIDDNSSKTPAPYFSLFSLSLRTYPNPNTHQNEIIAIACMVNTAFNLDQCLKRNNKASGHFCIMTKPPSGHQELKLPYDFHLIAKKHTKTRLEVVNSERDLLIAFIDKFSDIYDPDIVVGHDLLNFDYETLVARMNKLKVGGWAKLGRFRRTELPSTKAAFRYLFSGRILCDIRVSAMELIKARSYDLTELALQILERKRVEYNRAMVVEAFKSSENLLKLIHATWEDTDSIFSILVELNVIPLALKITNITGNILSRTLAAGRSERNEYLLLHAFHEDNFICPEKQLSRYIRGKSNQTSENPEAIGPIRKKAAYAGGLVLEPKAGYYDTCILLMDFNSLYPSIIQEFNICFSTIKVPEPADDGTELIATIPDENIATGILPSQLKNLVDRRRRVKRLLADSKSSDDKLMLDIEQKALKLTANSMYGCLGFEQSRFYAKHLASLVTFKGREILMSTKAMVEKLGYEVIYGDTDSLMINTKIVEYDEVIQRGTSIKDEINRTFKLLEIDIDGIYRPMLLLKKKNYAGSMIKKVGEDQFVKEIETKGLDTVRRDRAVIAKEAGERVLSMVLSGEKEVDQVVEDIHNYLKFLGTSIAANEIPREKFLISKQLNRRPEEYQNTKGLGHVTLALRHNNDSTKSRKLRAGDTVEYVICLDGTGESANQRAYTLEELSKEPERLKIDTEYYLCQQIHPVMVRICDKLPITNAYTLAEMLGIEKSNQLHIRRDDTEAHLKRDQLISKGDSRYDLCKPLIIVCPNCKIPDEIRRRTRKNKENKWEFSVSRCPQCAFRYAMRSRSIVVQVIDLIRRWTIELYSSKYICENSECNFESRNLFCPLTSEDIQAAAELTSADSEQAQPHCAQCYSPMLAEMDDRKLDLHLNYLKHLFDPTKREPASNGNGTDQQQPSEEPQQDLLEMFEQCQKEIVYALRCSVINNIDAHSVFSMICSGC